jgi:hypothetical protein
MPDERRACYGLGHGIRFGPDDLRAEIPAVRAQGEREEPGRAHEILRLEVGVSVDQVLLPRAALVAHDGLILRPVDGVVRVAAAVVRIAHFQPHDSIASEHSARLTEHGNEGLTPSAGGFFEADLAVHSVVPQREKRWRGDDALDALAWHERELLERVAVIEAHVAVVQPCCGACGNPMRAPGACHEENASVVGSSPATS